MTGRGGLVCVGVGMTLGSHLTPLARSYIEKADVVFTALSDGIIELWLARMNPDVRSLQGYYREGKSRRDTYRQMVDAMLTEVRAGKQVCGAFYGHPGVFALPPHRAIRIARREGYPAHMEPGVSAEDCLYADLGIDPGQYGCQHYEASQLMFFKRRLDTSAYLIVWQVGVAGDQSLARFSTGPEYRQILIDVLARDYPLDHEVILYEAATLPTHQPRMHRLPLAELAGAQADMHATLVVPPATALQPDPEIRQRLTALDRSASQESSSGRVRDESNAAFEFDTARLSIRPLSKADEALYRDLYTDAATMQFIGPPLSVDRAARSFRNYLRSPSRSPVGQLLLAIVDKATGRPVGICTIQQLDERRRRAEAGIMLKPAAHGREFGKEGLAALVNRAFAVLPIDEIWVQVAADHAVVERLVISVGFARSDDAGAEEYSAKCIWRVHRSSWIRDAAAGSLEHVGVK